jgi:hypothetical protein
MSQVYHGVCTFCSVYKSWYVQAPLVGLLKASYSEFRLYALRKCVNIEDLFALLVRALIMYYNSMCQITIHVIVCRMRVLICAPGWSVFDFKCVIDKVNI